MDPLQFQDHRPWALPRGAWVMSQVWQFLLFAHWPLPPEALRSIVPEVLPLDLFEGQAWIGVVPFEIVESHLHGVPPLPMTSRFAELNVRTYVTLDGKPGVYFFSLDAANAAAVEAARLAYHLPYFHARMRVQVAVPRLRYSSARRPGAPPAVFEASYWPVSDVAPATPGTLEHWLTERYCLYAVDGQGYPYRGEIHHAPWPLQKAAADIQVNTMTAGLGLALPDRTPSCSTPDPSTPSSGPSKNCN